MKRLLPFNNVRFADARMRTEEEEEEDEVKQMTKNK